MLLHRLTRLAALTALAVVACVDSTAPAPTPFKPGELRAVVTALDTVGGSDPGPYTAAAALLFARTIGAVTLDSITTSPAVTGSLGGAYRAIAVLVNVRYTTAASPTSTTSSLFAVIGWNGYNATTGTVENAFAVAISSSLLQPSAGTSLTAPLLAPDGFATLGNRASAARFYADSGSFTATSWTSGARQFCGQPGGTLGDSCEWSLGTLDGAFTVYGSTPTRSGTLVVPRVSLRGIPLVVLNWTAAL